MKFIDTHTHINLRAFKDDAVDVIQRAHDAGVGVINVGTQIDTSREAVSMLEQFPRDVYAVVGLHPTHTYTHNYIDEDEVQVKTQEEGFNYELYKTLAQNDRVIGIGECGLDYYRMPKDQDEAQIKELQRVAFLEQIKLAKELDKVLCIHCRPSDGTEDAYQDLIKILKTEPEVRFEVHCYTGSAETALEFVELGGLIGINGIITFDKSGRSEAVIKAVPLESILLETDAPYLTPKSMRGKRNEPAYIIEVAEKIAEWKGATLEEVAEQTTSNAKKLFKI